MRAGYSAVLAAVLLSSCGLETLEYLPAPTVADYQAQSDFGTLSLAHNPADYSGTNFLGYEIYYKIYPVQPGSPFGNLVADLNRLGSTDSRTLPKLVSLGYSRLNSSPSSSAAEPLVRLPLSASATTVELDFAMPDPKLSYGSTDTPTYRTVTSGAIASFPSFSALQTWTGAASDMDASVTQTSGQLEVDVFVVSYSFTPEKTVYSQPAPWGVLTDAQWGVP